MSNKKATKRALLTSILAICLCLVMLIGSTFAWFTDIASTSVNQIQSGTLDVDIVDKDGNSLTGTNAKKLEFVKATGAPTGEAVLWEPGVTYNTAVFKIKNAGNLALKWKVEIVKDEIKNGIVGSADTPAVSLLEVIKFSVVGPDGKAVAIENFEDHLSKGTTSGEYYLQGHMDEKAGNQYQGLTLDGVGIKVYATQYTEEYDSTTNQYDKMAEYSDGTSGGNTGDDPVVNPTDEDTYTPADSEELADFLKRTTAAEVTIYLKEGTTYTLPNISNKNVTFIGDGSNLIDMANSALTRGTNENLQLTFQNTTIQFSETDKQSIPGAGSVAYENCTIEGQYSMSGDQVRAAGCIFNGSVVYTGTAAETTFNRCTFNVAEGAAVYVCSSATGENYTVTIENCAFYSQSATKSAVVIGSDSGSNNAYDVKINNCVVNGFATGDRTGSELYDCSTDENVTVSMDGEKVYPQ